MSSIAPARRPTSLLTRNSTGASKSPSAMRRALSPSRATGRATSAENPATVASAATSISSASRITRRTIAGTDSR